MLATLLQSLAVASAGLFSVGAILLILLVLSSEGGVRKAFAFATAYYGSHLAIGLVAVVVGAKLQEQPDTGGTGAGPWISLGAGVFLLGMAARTLVQPRSQERPRWMRSLDELTARRLFLFGSVLPLVNVKNLPIYLSAIAILVEGELPLGQAALSVVAVASLFCLAVVGPVLLFALGGARTEPLLSSFRGFLERNSRPITLTLMSVFGSIFVIRGALQLLGE
jgi:threonine/homoserine/homoserine lactone efflux protein